MYILFRITYSRHISGNKFQRHGKRIYKEIPERLQDTIRSCLFRTNATPFGTGCPLKRYSVRVAEFEALALPIMDKLMAAREADRVVCILDEIGRACILQ